MSSVVLGTVLTVGITFVTFASLIVFATTNHYEVESCKTSGVFQSIYDTSDCPRVREQRSNETDEEYRIHRQESGCVELLHELSGIWYCPNMM